MSLSPTEIVQSHLGASRSSRTITEIARSTWLSRADVEAAIRQLAAKDRLWRDLRTNEDKLVTTWFLKPAPAARPEPHLVARLVDELADLEAA
jgi:hypothetical protein